MFEPCSGARLFGLAPGVDFPAQLVQGLIERLKSMPPHDMARVTVLVNTRRMQRRIEELFAAQGAFLLPQIRLVSDLARDMQFADIPAPVSPLRRRLQLTQLIAQLLHQQPDLAAKGALYDLADSLADLLDEMQGESVTPAEIAGLDVSDQSGHWARALSFIDITNRYFDLAIEPPDTEARQRLVVERLIKNWSLNQPKHPIILAGSTGSRGATHRLMTAISQLDQGAVVLPGFDFDMPASVWASMDDALSSEDHPQFRFHRLMNDLNATPNDIQPWTAAAAPSPARNALVSLALRPAPVTDQWMDEGGLLQNLDTATQDITLIEAPSARSEAGAIALRLRKAVQDGQTAALVTPDRSLTRQVTAALGRWNIVPDDSAGVPLTLSAPGRFLRQISGLLGQTITSETLLALLKHPLCHSGENRGQHLIWTRDLELHLRRYGPAMPLPSDIHEWAAKRNDTGVAGWAIWLEQCLFLLADQPAKHLADHVEFHLNTAAVLAAGVGVQGSGALREKSAGRAAYSAMQELQAEAEYGGILSPGDYRDLVRSVLHKSQVHDLVEPHPGVMIWGTLEARVQGADLVILAGLNDGTWPETPKPDPWLNRKMRADAGLLLPERRIGLSAHDFQQAIGAPEVWLTRSIRSAESETVASRWVNRLTNLLGGLTATGGTDALAAMRARGTRWIQMHETLESVTPVPPAPRPAPCPPVKSRPNRLAVTRIKTLIRDPFAIYAQYVLRLHPLDPLRQEASAPLRGTVLHAIFEDFLNGASIDDLTQERLSKVAQKRLESDVAWPVARHMWGAKLDRIAESFLQDERLRQSIATPKHFEKTIEYRLNSLDFTIYGTADRIDLTQGGNAIIYDYKTTVPTPKVVSLFDKQLLLEAMILAKGGASDLAPRHVIGASYIGVGAHPGESEVSLEDNPPEDVLSDLMKLIRAYQSPEQGYLSRRATSVTTHYGEYDHLARFGEWDESQPATVEVVK